MCTEHLQQSARNVTFQRFTRMSFCWFPKVSALSDCPPPIFQPFFHLPHAHVLRIPFCRNPSDRFVIIVTSYYKTWGMMPCFHPLDRLSVYFLRPHGRPYISIPRSYAEFEAEHKHPLIYKRLSIQFDGVLSMSTRRPDDQLAKPEAFWLARFRCCIISPNIEPEVSI